jgi:predicted N-acetyltransferase YhbS
MNDAGGALSLSSDSAVAPHGAGATPAQPYTLRLEQPRDAAEIDALYDETFGPARFTKTVERLREGNAPFRPGCFVAYDAEGLTGVVRLWPVACAGGSLLMLGPFAVAERRRGNGVGGKLILASLQAATEAGWGAVFLVGDPDYYARFGFEPVPAGMLTLPGPVDARRVLWRALRADGTAGLTGALRAPVS